MLLELLVHPAPVEGQSVLVLVNKRHTRCPRVNLRSPVLRTLTLYVCASMANVTGRFYRFKRQLDQNAFPKLSFVLYLCAFAIYYYVWGKSVFMGAHRIFLGQSNRQKECRLTIFSNRAWPILFVSRIFFYIIYLLFFKILHLFKRHHRTS